MPHTPPQRKPGWGTGKRRFNGEVLDVAGAAEFLGGTPDFVRSRVSRGLLPHRRWGGRVIFLRSELEKFLIETLPGVSLAQAKQNLESRKQ
jgi:hypothetical protein